MIRTLLLLLALLPSVATASSITWVAIGASNTSGPKPFILIDTWPDWLQDLGIAEVAAPGSTVQWWQDLPQELYAERVTPLLPSLTETSGIVMDFGTNARGVGMTAAEFQARYLALIGMAQADGFDTTVLILPPDVLGQTPAQAALLADYRVAIAAICAGDPAVHCGPDLFDLFGSDPQWFFPDGKHLTELAQQQVAIAIRPTLEALIPQPVPALSTGWLIVGAVLWMVGLAAVHRAA